MTTAPLVADPAALCRQIVAAVETVFVGKRAVVEQVMVAVLARGHVLFEDVPGVGKTTLARTFAQVLGLTHHRIQFASDLLPADIVGVGIYDPDTRQFEFKPGPVFCHVLLADEINRTTPRTQSALLEAMAEARVTVDGTTHLLPQPHVVLATQNPREFHGTFPLPESQLDRFLLRVSVGYLDAQAEMALIANASAAERSVQPVVDAAQVQALIAAAGAVHVAPEVLGYLHALVQATRHHRGLELGLSTRAAIGLYRAVQARALVAGRVFATPDDVQALFVPVANHRVVVSGPGGTAGERIAVEAVLHQVLESVAAPA
ncbi:MAG: MoxR family ATPase [Deltaproteobacteria bacterium]|nr:MoxR family ATPase [Deltaproteobacteria bacterium]